MFEETINDSSSEGSINSYAFWKDLMRSGKLPLRRNLVYPSFRMRLGLEGSRDMQTFIIVKSRVNGKITTIGKTNTIFLRAGETMHFIHEISLSILVGIDDNQSVIFEIMDGDKLGVSDGYLFEAREVGISKLVNSKKNLFIIRRGEDLGPPLCKLYVNVILQSELQSVSMHTKDPNKIGFFQPRPPTKDDVRAATPSFTQTFGTYIVQFAALDLLSERSVDPARIHTGITSVSAKLLLSDPENFYEDTDTTEGNLQLLWKSQPQYRPMGSKTYDLVFPEIKITHIDLTGSPRTDCFGLPQRRLIIQIWVQGLNLKGDANSAPEMISYASMDVKELIETATAIQGEEVEVCRRLARMKRKGQCLRFNFMNFKDLSRQEHEVPAHGRHHRKSIFGNLLSRPAKDEDNDSFEDELAEVVDKQNVSDTHKKLKKFETRQSFRKQVGLLTPAFGLSTKRMQDDIVRELVKSQKPSSRRSIWGAARPENHSPNSFEKINPEILQTEHARNLLNDFNYGNMELNIGRALVSLSVESGDSVYEEKLERKWKHMVQSWNQKNFIEFQKAADDQKELTSRATKNVELLLDDSKDGLLPSFVIDMNASCLQHLQSKAAKQDFPSQLKGQMSSTNLSPVNGNKIGFSGSNVLQATRIVFHLLQFFVKEDQFHNCRMYGGGGVHPPSDKHPSYGYSRASAFPLVQELLLNVAKASGNGMASIKEGQSYLLHNPKLRHQADPHGVLQSLLEERTDIIKGASCGSWQGYKYSITQHYRDWQDVIQGFMEACTIYEPSVLNRTALRGSLGIFSDAADAVTSTSMDHEAKQSQEKLYNDHKNRMLAAYVGTPYNINAQANDWFSAIPPTMQYDVLNSCDVEAIELLLRNTRAKPMATAQHAALPTEGLSAPVTSHQRAVVWVLGQCPGADILQRVGTVFEEHILSDTQAECLLLVVLAAETRFDLPEAEPESMNIIAQPFAPLITCFEQAVQRAHAEIQKRWRAAGVRPHAALSPSQSPTARRAQSDEQPTPESSLHGKQRNVKTGWTMSTPGDSPRSNAPQHPPMELNTRQYIEGQFVRRDNLQRKQGGLVHQASHNIVLSHYMTWAEIIGQAFQRETTLTSDINSSKRSQYTNGFATIAISDVRTAAAAGFPADPSTEAQIKHTPCCSHLKVALESYFPHWVGEAVIGRLEGSEVVEGPASGADMEPEALPAGSERKGDGDKATPQYNVKRGSLSESAKRLSVHTGRKSMTASMRDQQSLQKDRVSGVRELDAMKKRFDKIRDNRVALELNAAISSFLQSVDLLNEDEQEQIRRMQGSTLSASGRQSQECDFADQTYLDGNVHPFGVSPEQLEAEGLHDFSSRVSGKEARRALPVEASTAYDICVLM